MDFRKNLLVALVATLTLTACPGRDQLDGGEEEEDAGCTGVCSTDGGQDAGVNPCAGVTRDGGFVTLEQLRDLPVCGQYVNVQNVVVHSVLSLAADPLPDGGTGWDGEFYVTLGDGGVGPGVYVEKSSFDSPNSYKPNVGDRLNVLGILWEGHDNRSSAPHNLNRHGYRKELRSAFEIDGGTIARLFITPLNANNPHGVTTVDESFSSQSGRAQPHPELLGSYVFLPGPVEITNAFPEYMLRYNSRDGGELFLADNRDNYQGYEVTGGITVVDNANRFNLDGGGSDCDWRHTARDAGAGKVVFPNGIGGVWETYTQVPFCDPFPACLSNLSGFILLDGGERSDVLHAIYPIDCPRDMDGGFYQP